MDIKKIGFVGIGIMGEAMARNLMKAGYQLWVYNRTKSKAERLIVEGARWSESPAECAAESDAVITIVGYPQDVEVVYFGENGIFEGVQNGTYLIDMTTSSPTLAQKIYDEALKRECHAVDAPVTGGDTGAKAGTLSILAGGQKEDFEALLSVFQAMGKSIYYMGGPGAGQKTKLCNQIAIAGALSGACEALSFAKACGLDVQEVLKAISGGAAGSFQLSNVASKGVAGDWNPGFMLKHFLKDMKLAQEAARESHINLRVLEQVAEEAKDISGQGQADLGTQVLLNYYLDWMGQGDG